MAENIVRMARNTYGPEYMMDPKGSDLEKISFSMMGTLGTGFVLLFDLVTL